MLGEAWDWVVLCPAPGRIAQAQSPAWGSSVPRKPETQDEIHPERKVRTSLGELAIHKTKNRELCAITRSCGRDHGCAQDVLWKEAANSRLPRAWSGGERTSLAREQVDYGYLDSCCSQPPSRACGCQL